MEDSLLYLLHLEYVNIYVKVCVGTNVLYKDKCWAGVGQTTTLGVSINCSYCLRRDSSLNPKLVTCSRLAGWLAGPRELLFCLLTLALPHMLLH